MNQLEGKYVNVVLSVEDGRGMDFVRHPIHVAGNYCGRILESDQLTPECRTMFNTELIWEVEKKDLRKLRSSNQPLRVECLSTDPQNRRDRIGFVLLSLRSAQIITLKEAKSPVSFKWYKLIGCQADKKKHHPELYLALTIRDHLLNGIENPQKEENMPLISEEEQPQANEDVEFSTTFPLRYLDDGYIHIGDSEDYESFSLNLLVKEARNLDNLLPEALVFRQNQEKYHMSFKLFGVIIKTKPFYKNFHDTFFLNEKVVVRILSNEQTLSDFFNAQSIKITLFSGHEVLGITEVAMGGISFQEETTRSYFRLPTPDGVVPFGGDTTSPFLEIKAWLKRSTESKFKPNQDLRTPTKIFRSHLEKAATPRGDGDQIPNLHLPDHLEKIDLKSKSECSIPSPDCDNVVITKSVDTVIKSVPLSPRNVPKYDVRSGYVKYNLEVNLQHLVWKIPPKEKIVIFKFLHPRASNYITIFTQLSNVGETVDLKNIGMKVSYVSTIDHITNILNAWPPKLLLTDEREKLLSEEYEFDASKFFHEDFRTYKYVADLKAVRTFQPLAKLQIMLNLEECDLGDNVNTDFQLQPPIIDELISIKELASLESWKKCQKEIFEKEMEKFMEKERVKLEQEWQEKKLLLEQKLDNQMQKCKNLQEEMQRKLNSMKTDKYLGRRRNHANIFEEIFTENWEKYNTADIKEVITVLSRNQRDNEYLRKLVEDQRQKLEKLEKTALTKEQTVSLLQELKGLERNFEEAQHTKEYFKEQWRKACEEIHQMKTEEYKEIQIKLKKSKEQLSNLSLESFSNFVRNTFEDEELSPLRSIPSAQSFYKE
ncbi:centrosomal protein of 120 kDa-like isoform X2 [Anthonomus grandis grandis]|uniref:centrosomal protein of 120 kDa-like isoform X2 n=1 Tax=Anthonomus grandis grandis TaxID=2921223 RepID=UPI0021658151|nr:centrosomal protein of 120 kDa-like isoform X2 [Anthonomus grandis grandis]